MIDWSKPVRHVDSKKPYRVLCTDGQKLNCPVVVMSPDGEVYSVSLGGGFGLADRTRFENPPKTLTQTIYLYDSPTGPFFCLTEMFDGRRAIGRRLVTITEGDTL